MVPNKFRESVSERALSFYAPRQLINFSLVNE